MNLRISGMVHHQQQVAQQVCVHGNILKYMVLVRNT